jgi:hypothetical protein
MLRTNLHYAGAFFNPYLLGEVHLHDDADAKKTLNQVLWKNTCNSHAYGVILIDFVNFGGIIVKQVHTNLHPLPIASWHKCVPHPCVRGIRVHIHLSTTKFEID